VLFPMTARDGYMSVQRTGYGYSLRCALCCNAAVLQLLKCCRACPRQRHTEQMGMLPSCEHKTEAEAGMLTPW
jgi:hypothetical protein